MTLKLFSEMYFLLIKNGEDVWEQYIIASVFYVK